MIDFSAKKYCRSNDNRLTPSMVLKRSPAAFNFMQSLTPDQYIEEAIRVVAKEFPPADKLIKPTVLHSIRVGLYLYDRRYPWEVCVGGLLHDILEDTEMRATDITKKFGKQVLGYVQANTQNDTILSTDERRADLISRCAEHSEGALIIKCADILDNYSYYQRLGKEEQLERCKALALLVKKFQKKTYRDPLFKILYETVLR